MEILERDVTEAELQRSVQARSEEAERAGTAIPATRRLGAVVAEDGACLAGAVLELYEAGGAPQAWCFLAELFVERRYRHQGLGSLLLGHLEREAAQRGVRSIWTRTAGYEAPGFYARQGYRVFAELERWYPSGHAAVFVRKSLTSSPASNAPGDARLVARMPTAAELDRINQGFVEHGLEFGNPPRLPQRLGFVATEYGAMIGFVSGLADRAGASYDPWFTLTDLFVEPAHRGHGLGTELLQRMHQRLAPLGIHHVCTWTPGYQTFLQTQGYDRTATLEHWYPNHHARQLLRTTLTLPA